MTIRSIIAVSALAASLGFGTAAFASYAIPDADTGSGTVQAVNYAMHTVTVDGHVYKLSPKAVYIGGRSRDLGGLQPGMKVNFIADGPVASPDSRIVNIVVLPPNAP